VGEFPGFSRLNGKFFDFARKTAVWPKKP